MWPFSNKDKNSEFNSKLNKAKAAISQLHDIFHGLNDEEQRVMYQKIINPLASSIVEMENIICEQVVNRVDKILNNYESQKDISKFANDLTELYNFLATRGNGKFIKNYPEKRRLSFCFYLMIDYLDFSDPDFYEVCAENAFYCIVNYNKNAWFFDRDIDINTFFLILHYGGKHMNNYIHNVLENERNNNNSVLEFSDFKNGPNFLLNQFKMCLAYIYKFSEAEVTLTGEPRKELNILLKNVHEIDTDKVLAKCYLIAEYIENVLEEF